MMEGVGVSGRGRLLQKSPLEAHTNDLFLFHSESLRNLSHSKEKRMLQIYPK